MIAEAVSLADVAVTYDSIGRQYTHVTNASVVAAAMIRIVAERAALVCEEQAKHFLSPDYATEQPLSSFNERFACKECARAIRELAKALTGQSEAMQHGNSGMNPK